MSRPIDERLELVAITPGRGLDSDLFEACGRLVEGGVTMILLREPSSTAAELYRFGHSLRDEILGPRDVALGISDRLDVALALDADAVHLGYRSLSPMTARRLCGRTLAVGFSLHDPIDAHEEAVRASDYVTFGPVFETPSKMGWVEATGVERLKEVARTLPIPVVALGGLDAEGATALAGSGVAGVAAIRALFDASDRVQAAREFGGLRSPPENHGEVNHGEVNHGEVNHGEVNHGEENDGEASMGGAS